MKRLPIGWLLLAGLALATLWLTVATRYANIELERKRPVPVYDFFSYYRPNAEYAFARMQDGELPLWNPNQGLGEPFLATLQTGVLYPPNWLHLAMPSQRAYVWLAFAHLALATVLAGSLARSLGAGTVGGIAAGLLYAGSLQLWSSVWTPPILYTAAWAPGVLLAVERAVQRPGAGRAASLAIVVGLMLLAGWPYAVLMTVLAAVIMGGAALLRALWQTRKVPLTALATLVCGAVAGGMLAAPQLLPSIELAGLSARAPGTLDDHTVAREGNIHDPQVFFHSFVHDGISGGVPGLASPVLALAAVAFAGLGRAAAATLLAVASLALGVSFPQHLPFHDWLRHLPFLGDFRFPFRYRLISTLGIAVCAGVGISRLEATGRRGAVLAAALAVIAVTVQAWPMARHFQLVANSFPRARPTGSGGLFAQPGLRKEHAQQIAFARQPEHASWRSYWSAFGVDKLGEREHLRTLQDLEPLSLSETSRMMTFLSKGDAGVDPARGNIVRPALGAPYWGSAPLPDEPSRAALFDWMSVRLLVVDAPPAWLDKRYHRNDKITEAPFVFENPHALPRAWRATRTEAQPADVQNALARLVDPHFEVGKAVLLDPLPDEAARWKDVHDPSAATRIEYDAPESIAIRTSGVTSAVLVLNDAFYPGWEATLDDEPVPLLRANTAFRAVLVPPGEHRVEMHYRPRSLDTGVALAAVAGLGLGVGMMLERVAARRESA